MTDWRDAFMVRARRIRASNMFLSRRGVERDLQCKGLMTMLHALQDLADENAVANGADNLGRMAAIRLVKVDDILDDPEKMHFIDSFLRGVPRFVGEGDRQYAQEDQD